jgi:hypothetical protein
MGKKIILSILVPLLVSSLLPIPVHAQEDPWWNQEWSCRQEIPIPIDTSNSLAWYQPIDTTILFEQPCWAPDEQHSSVRVIVQGDGPPEELESQIYELDHTDPTHIASCNLVFLIPGNTTGNERYYLYYDEAQTEIPTYPDHVTITDSYTDYEPLPGYPMKSHFYKISQDGFYTYTITQDAYILWYTASQLVSKAVPNTTEIIPKNEEMTASFDFAYYYGPEASQLNSTSDVLVSKQILVDGNLMVSCRLDSRSKGDDLETTAVYTYYYCPTPQKRILAHVTDTALQDCHVYPDTQTDGTYCTVQSAHIQSSAVEELNGGNLLTNIHVYTEANTVDDYSFDLTPDTNPNQRSTFIITATDDVDLGLQAWATMDKGGTTGEVHAIMFRSTSVVKEGANERDGIQIKAFESAYPHVPGLTHDTTGFECTRNTYETGDGPRNLLIPKGFKAEFDAEFFSSPIGGYPIVEQEVPLFRALAEIKPSSLSNGTAQQTETGKSSLTVFVHESPSFPFGAGISILTGRKFPYITVELYKNDERLSSGTAGRLALGQFSSTSTTLFGKFVATAHLMDLKNFSLFKKIQFRYLEPGEYLVKVFKDNPFLGKDHQYIGYAPVTLKGNDTVHIRCTKQGLGEISLTDQEENKIQGALVTLCDGTNVIAQNITDQQGIGRVYAPCDFTKKYTLQVYNKGFLVDSEQVSFGFLRALFPFHTSLQTDEYDWRFNLLDTWGLAPAVNITPQLSSKEMAQPMMLLPIQQEPGVYSYAHLPPALYHLLLQYKSFRVEHNVTIPASETSYVFPAAFPVTFQIVDARGLGVTDALLYINRSGKTKTLSLNSSSPVVSLPPGEYAVSVVSQNEIINQRPITVSSERTIELITTREPLFPLIGILSIIVVGVVFSVFGIRKKDPVMLLVSLALCLAVIASMLPWWSLSGSTSDVTTSSTLYLTPPAFVTITRTASVLTGELSYLPDLFITILLMILVMVVLGCLLCCASVLFHWMQKPRMRLLSILGALIIVGCGSVMFLVAMTMYSEVSVGSIQGAGEIGVTIPGISGQPLVACHWGLATGFYVYVIVIGFLLAAFILLVRKKKNSTKG